MKNICADSCFLIALYDESDPYHSESERYFVEAFENTRNRLVVPWPVLYESVSTRMVRSIPRMTKFERDWTMLKVRNQLLFLDGSAFRERAIEGCLLELGRPRGSYRYLSLVDRVIRELISDVNIKIDALLTFNIPDFVDLCFKLGKEIVPQGAA